MTQSIFIFLSNNIPMYCPKAIPFLLLAFFGCFSSPADAQVNLKTGYNFSIVSNGGLDEIISSVNQSQSYSAGFKRMAWLHGFEAGLRYAADMHALELTYQGGYQTLKATYQENDQTQTDRIKFGVHSLGIGYQLSDRLWGFGTDLQYQLYKTRFLAAANTEAFRNTQNMFAMKFYLMLTLKGAKGVDMALQPYYVLPFKAYNNLPLANHLQVNAEVPSEKWTRFGITILFYNGEK